MDNVLAFEPAFYGTTQAAGSLLYGKSSQNTMLIHPSTRSGHIDSDLAVTNVDSFTVNLGELTMITGVVLMAAPAPEVRAAYNYVKNDDGVIWGPAPDYQGCQAQCDICNLEEDDSDPADIFVSKVAASLESLCNEDRALLMLGVESQGLILINNWNLKCEIVQNSAKYI